jgi:4-hydroxybenzoate polyprenyltransferase
LSQKANVTHLPGRSILQLLVDLRLHYVVVSSSLTLLGLFWNNLEGFDWTYGALLMSVFCANLFGFMVNDFYDSAYDVKELVKKTRNVFCSSTTTRLGKGVVWTSLGLSLVFGGMVSPPVLVIIAFFDVLAFSYSAPPIRLRSRLYWDWIFVFLWKGIIMFTGYFYFSGLRLSQNPFILGTSVIVLLSSFLNQIYNQLRDFQVDYVTNTNNSVQHLGYQKASTINRVLLLAFYTVSFGFCVCFGLYATMISILLNVFLYVFVDSKKSGKIIQLSTIWMGILFLEHVLTSHAYP